MCSERIAKLRPDGARDQGKGSTDGHSAEQLMGEIESAVYRTNTWERHGHRNVAADDRLPTVHPQLCASVAGGGQALYAAHRCAEEIGLFGPR